MNHLANETSPYLLQHANNPVNWYPWGDEAITKARTENKPILLSIGYSACHWCHVMAHESFEDEGTAELMNKLFVNIKVDREERPDLDKVYQTAHYLLTRHQGGWPLTVFLTPDDLTPFFAGTYFPRNTRYGMLPFVEVLLRIADAYQTQHTEIQEQNKLLQQALTNMAAQFTTENCQISAIPLQKSIDEITQLFDAENGGFSTAPKFPHTDMIDSLLQIGSLNVDKKALNMSFFTLEKMALGGIYDQLAGGFSRYSVDEFWMIPHFEKMLYDNALLLNVYVDAAKLSKNPLFVKIAEQTANWIIKEMQSAEGGYYSAIDADSEDKEGKFYVWDKEEIAAHLTPEEFAVIERYYNLQKPANFEGKWHLYVSNDLPTVAKELNISVAKAQSIIETANNKLLKIREKRVPPARDEKILTSWNALMIKSMAKAGKYLQKPELIISARKAMHFIREKMWREQRLLATYKDKRAHLNAYLDDYAFLLEALLILLEVEWCSQDLQFAIEIADIMLAKFFDEKEGGFFFTSHDHEQLLQRLKLWSDEALPAGNGVAAFALGRLGYLLGEQRYLVAAEKTLQAGWNSLIQAPYAHNSLLKALEDYIKPPRIIILRGEKQLMQDWLQDYEHHYQSQQICVAIPVNDQQLPAALQQYKNIAEITAYSCENFQCAAPITKKEDFIKFMKVD